MSGTKKRLVIIGGGMAGVRVIEEILAITEEMFAITLLGAEAGPHYSRPRLPDLLSGGVTPDEIILHDAEWFHARAIDYRAGETVIEIMRGYKKVITASGAEVPYDNLIIATGSRPITPPIRGNDKEGVHSFRNLADFNAVNRELERTSSVVIAGGGLLGLEAAHALAQRGKQVTVVHRHRAIMNRQLDETASTMLSDLLFSAGVQFRLGASIEEITGGKRVEAVRLDNGLTISCGLVIFSTGIAPETTLAQKGRLACQRGILVSDTLQSLTDSTIYAVGECAEHRGATYGFVAPLYEQARALAHQITGQGFASFSATITGTRLKVSGIELYAAGQSAGDTRSETIEYQDRAAGIYRKALLKNNRVIGAITLGPGADGPRLLDMIRSGKKVNGARQSLLFGDLLHRGDIDTATPDKEIVCGCNGVTRTELVSAITKGRLTILDQVKEATGAATACGGCSSVIARILEETIGRPIEPAAKPICPCTSFTHDEVKDAISENRFITAREVIRELGFKNDGCHICRPALNYYLELIWPGEAVDDPQSRVVDEREHATMQKDGSFSIVPRAYGGMVTADELIRIGEVANKYNVPALKYTGGQRIDMLGVPKEQLVAIWRDLGLPSGYAYAKGIRTVKSCVGSTWCRFGVQDSLAFAARIEHTIARVCTPAKFKLAVSGCPRNCAEATIKDVGVVAVTGGWQIHIGGNGGLKVRVTDHLCTVKTEDEAMEIIMALVQYNREEGIHGERVAPFVERLGLARIKEDVIENRKNRSALVKRLERYLMVVSDDPWKRRVDAAARAGKDAQTEALVFNPEGVKV